MEIIGKVKVINPEQQVSAAFKKRELVVTTDEQYPQQILIEFHQDKCDLLNNYKEGQNVKVGINLRGREWISPQGETKYFNTITGWRIFEENPGAQSPPPSAAPQYATKTNPQEDSQEQDDDQLPF